MADVDIRNWPPEPRRVMALVFEAHYLNRTGSPCHRTVVATSENAARLSLRVFGATNIQLEPGACIQVGEDTTYASDVFGDEAAGPEAREAWLRVYLAALGNPACNPVRLADECLSAFRTRFPCGKP